MTIYDRRHFSVTTVRTLRCGIVVAHTNTYHGTNLFRKINERLFCVYKWQVLIQIIVFFYIFTKQTRPKCDFCI